MRLILGEDRERLELRIAGGDEDDVESEQGEKDAVGYRRPVAPRVLAILSLRVAAGHNDE